MTGHYTKPFREYFAAHGIDEEIAAFLGVTGYGKKLGFTYCDADGEGFERTKNVSNGDVRQPARKPVVPWTPVGTDGDLLVCEGEPDCLAAISAMYEIVELPDEPDHYGRPKRTLQRKQDLPAPVANLTPIAIPGANTCHRKVAELVERKVSAGEGVDGEEKFAIWIALDGDDAGRANAEKLANKINKIYGIKVGIVPLPDGKDLSDVHAGAEDPVDVLANLVAEAEAAAEDVQGADDGDLTPSDNRATVQPPVDREAEWAKCASLAVAPSILNCFTDQLAAAGLVGEDKLAKIIYLATVSRMLPKPVNVAVKGPSAGGKSFTVEMVLKHFPDDAYYALSAMSERALAYSEEPLVHRMLVIYEAAGMESDFASYLLRSLLSEGCVRYETVEKTKDGIKAKLIERPGPTGLIVTTTRTSLHPENETRLISLVVKDTPEQTRAVLRAIADEDAAAVDVEPWHALQRWLERHPVTVPYAGQLAEKIPAVAVRLRRDFGSVLGLIRSHALLHQATRERDDRGRIVATVEDYAVVRELVSDLVAAGLGAAVSAETRETVDAVDRLADAEGITQKALAAELHLDKSAISRRVRVAVNDGYLRNLEDRRGRPARLVVGDPLPEDLEVLPPPETLGGCTVARLIEGDNQDADLQGEAERLEARFGAAA